jgi:hypothetical protein
MDEEDDDDYEEHLKAQRRYGWFRKLAIFNEVENLWLDYMEVIDYPGIDFTGYVAKNYYRARDREGARYLIWIWKFVRSFEPKYLN